ncbi:peptidase C39, partial [Mycolicibacterium farcinogenes]|nr:peptidase C39 [Mycolicibacterium farcinogenes]
MALTDKQQQELYDEVMKRGPSRAALAEDGKDIETMLGYIYNIDGNIWDGRNAMAYLLDVPYAVEAR